MDRLILTSKWKPEVKSKVPEGLELSYLPGNDSRDRLTVVMLNLRVIDRVLTSFISYL